MSRRVCYGITVGVLLFVCSHVSAGHESFSCGQCHISHIGQPSQGDLAGTWNSGELDDGLPTFTLYSSESFDSLGTDISQPTGTSMLCLGCHDGSYDGFGGAGASGAVFGANDLAKSHPISFTYDSSLASRVAGGALKDPTITPSGLGNTISRDLLEGGNKMQCTSCHDVHASAVGPKLLRYEYGGASGDTATMCRVCHNR